LGPLLTAINEGHWLFLDELNLGQPEVLFRINMIIDEIRNPLCKPKFTNDIYLNLPEIKEFSSIKVHKNFRLFAAMNFSSEVGRKRISPALLDKFV